MEKYSEKDQTDLSVIYYVRNEEDIVEGIVDELVEEVEKLSLSYEILGLNVPSIDNSYDALKRLGNKHEHFYPIDMVQVKADNIQKGYQMMLGCRLARGRKIVIMDSDGQVDPRDIGKVVKKLDDGCDAVFGWRQERKGKHGFLYNFTSWGQNVVFRILSGVKIHDKNTGLKAFTDVAAKSMNLYGRNFRDLAVQLKCKGFKLDEVPINWRERTGGIQTFKFWDRLLGGTFDLIADVFIARMIDKPVRFWGLLTVSSWSISFAVGIIGTLNLIFGVVDLGGGFSWWNLFWVGVTLFFMVLGIGALFMGIIMEFMVSQRQFDLTDYYIRDDQKGIVKERLG